MRSLGRSRRVVGLCLLQLRVLRCSYPWGACSKVVPGNFEAVTDVERLVRFSTPQPFKGPRQFRWVVPILAVVTVISGTVAILASPASASLQNEKSQAATLYTSIQTLGAKVSALGQRYDQAQITIRALNGQIASGQRAINSDQRRIVVGTKNVQNAVVFEYVTNKNGAVTSPVLLGNANKIGATKINSGIAEGNAADALARLKFAKQSLTRDRQSLHQRDLQAGVEARSALAVLDTAQTLQKTMQQELARVKGAIALDVRRIEAAAAAANARRLRSARPVPTPKSGGATVSPSPVFAAPPANSRANLAIRAALTYLGVPYVWGGASRSGVDCSGLVMLAYEAAGINFPHYSGAQYQDTARVPLYDIQPGDILFYGPGGDTHDAIYLGGGKMIEAPETGYNVHITPIRLYGGFIGIGRP